MIIIIDYGALNIYISFVSRLRVYGLFAIFSFVYFALKYTNTIQVFFDYKKQTKAKNLSPPSIKQPIHNKKREKTPKKKK